MFTLEVLIRKNRKERRKGQHDRHWFLQRAGAVLAWSVPRGREQGAGWCPGHDRACLQILRGCGSPSLNTHTCTKLHAYTHTTLLDIKRQRGNPDKEKEKPKGSTEHQMLALSWHKPPD